MHTYDAIGRPSKTTQTLTDGTYTSTQAYDAWGRVISQTYQRNTDPAKQFDSRYHNGYLARVERGSLVLWKVNAQDAGNRPTSVALGNGLTQSRVFNPHMAQMTSGALSTAGNVARLQEGYDYDPLSNVVWRQQFWDQGGFQESFTYDALNRLATSTVESRAKQTFLYDAAGNLLSKTGVGTGNYTYPAQGATAVRPHAVQSIPGIGSFVYDDNGNLTSGAGRTMSWTSFDMPLTITGGGVSATFVYGPEHQRIRQTRGDGSAVVYAGAQEVEKNTSGTTVKTYWPGGIGVEIDRPGATVSELYWHHLDRLGSVIGLTDQQGVLKEKLGYDAWGKRRSIDGASTPNNLDGQVDNRGYTGHEILDQLDLVHMNGRVYDPLVARFISADPYISNIVNGQELNRFSYVLNNPTNLTDPTGFCPEKKDCEPAPPPPPPEPKEGEKMPRVEVKATKSSNGTSKVDAKAGGAVAMGSASTSMMNSRGSSQGQKPRVRNQHPVKMIIELLLQKVLTNVLQNSGETDGQTQSDTTSEDAKDGEKSSSKGGAKKPAKPGREKDVPNRGELGEVREGERRTREYGHDGKPLRDYDKPHQGYDRPHVHEWPGGEREHPGRDYSPWPKQ